MKRAAKTRKQRAGFTLVELLVAMVAGSFVITGAYYMSDVSSRMFSEQLRRSETQMTLRSATELLRRDIGRAGYLSVRDSAEVLGCDTTAVAGAPGPGAFNVTPQVVTAALVDTDPATGRQRLFITGNLTTSDQYFVSASNGMTLQLQTTNESYRRSFVDPNDGVTFMPNRFLEAFFPDPALPGPGRMVSVADLSKGRLVLRNILGVAMGTTPPTLTLQTSLPMDAMGGGCMNYDKIVVAPVTTVRYAMEIPGAALSRVGGRTYMTGARATDNALHPVLVRSEVDANTKAVLPGTERVVLDSVQDDPAGFQISAVIDNALAPAVNLVHTATPETLLAAQSGQIRSLSIQLVVESSERVESGTPEMQRLTALRGRRIMRFEVMLPNTARNAGQF